MKKVILFAAIFCIVTSSMYANTIPQSAAFLAKLNLYYYSLVHQGLKIINAPYDLPS
jgi:hypothetical protein